MQRNFKNEESKLNQEHVFLYLWVTALQELSTSAGRISADSYFLIWFTKAKPTLKVVFVRKCRLSFYLVGWAPRGRTQSPGWWYHKKRPAPPPAPDCTPPWETQSMKLFIVMVMFYSGITRFLLERKLNNSLEHCLSCRGSSCKPVLSHKSYVKGFNAHSKTTY